MEPNQNLPIGTGRCSYDIYGHRLPCNCIEPGMKILFIPSGGEGEWDILLVPEHGVTEIRLAWELIITRGNNGREAGLEHYVLVEH